MKKVVGIISLALCAVLVPPAQATDEKVIAIIDTAIDSSKFNNIIYEVCFTGNATCPNKTVFQEGPGAANVDRWDASGMGHGYSVVYSAVNANPNIKIVFIRISNVAPGTKLPMAYNEGISLDKAIEWVSNNASKYSIDAVSISQSRINFAKSTCPKDVLFEESVKNLLSINVATFVATGNDSRKDQIGFPSCVSGVFPVGGLAPDNTVIQLSNMNSSVKILANACLSYNKNACIKTPDFAGVMRATIGTSISTPIASSILVGLWDGQPWSSFIDSLPKQNGFVLAK